MTLMMKFFTLALMAALTQSCGLHNSQEDEKVLLNKSALYDPPTITLIENVKYQFLEGSLNGRGQKFHSQFSYQQALIAGK